jgi:DNA-binding MarR family transcriptional regulator
MSLTHAPLAPAEPAATIEAPAPSAALSNPDATAHESGAFGGDVEATVRALRAAATHVELMLSRALEPHNLTATQYFVLQVMDEVHDESLRCSELGKRLVGPAPDVTRLLDRLESVGLVARERDKNDRRAVHSKLTPLGVETLNRARPHVRQAEAKALADLCPTSRQQLASLLGVVQKRCPGN